MREKYFVLINEEAHKITYALCVLQDTLDGPISRIERIGTVVLVDIVDLALRLIKDLDATVICDTIYGSALHGVASNYNWRVEKIKRRDEFPFVEFICGLRNQQEKLT